MCSLVDSILDKMLDSRELGLNTLAMAYYLFPNFFFSRFNLMLSFPADKGSGSHHQLMRA
jgi:hypothetical protein